MPLAHDDFAPANAPVDPAPDGAPDDGAPDGAPGGAPALALRLIAPDGLEAALAALPAPQAAFARAAGFAAKAGEALLLPGAAGVEGALLGCGAGRRPRFALGAAVARLPEGDWRLAGPLDPAEARELALGWFLEGYRFERYKAGGGAKARLVAPEGVEAGEIRALARAEGFARDLINTPAADMGPAELQEEAQGLARDHGAQIAVTAGTALAEGFPLIHAVGRAAAAERQPRLVDLRWGAEGPRLTLVGKGVTFDSGGLDIKPSASMLTMKKDMGGAAHALALGRAVMERGLPLRLRVLLPLAENAVGPDSLRPGDVLRSRKGPTVEINNTDAEGRLILADALALAGEEGCDLCACFATLTGAARVAVGADLAPFFTDDEGLAAGLMRGAADWADPCWRLPFHEPYEALIEPALADLDNAPAGGMAGAITAALFLRRFAPTRFVHFDVFAWTATAAPGRPKGATTQGMRALWGALPGALGL
jgi:leucyl aminopeptidase